MSKSTKKPVRKTLPFVLSFNTKENTLSFIEHRQDGSKYLVTTKVNSDFVSGIMKEFGKTWRETFVKKRLDNPKMGTSIMLVPPLPEPAKGPDGPSYA